MLNDLIKICKVFPNTDDDYDYLISNYRDFAFDIMTSKVEEELLTLPTLIIGWDKVQNLFPEQNKTISKIDDNLYWTYSSSENLTKFKSDIKSFLEFSIKKFFNKKLITFDYIIDGELKTFIANNINPKIRSYIYFHKNACYIHNENETYAISLSSLEFSGKDIKKIMTSLINKIECTIFSYQNITNYTYIDEIRDVMTLENMFWSKDLKYIEPKDFTNIFLLKDIHKNIPLLMKILMSNNKITQDEINSCKRQSKKDKITSWLSTNKIYFEESFNPTKEIRCKFENNKKYTILKYSDKRTITGRINCIDNFNPQTLPKDSEIRKSIISRFEGGEIVSFDYKSFETRLSMYLSRDMDFINQNLNSDFHINTAKVIFLNEEPTLEQREIGKNINHAILYGGGDKLLNTIIAKSNINDIEESIKRVKVFLAPILDTSNYINDVYKELGYIVNPFGTLIKPNKTYAAFNNYVQSTAADIVVDKLEEIKQWSKNKKSSLIFQVFDSFVFDISPEDKNAVEELYNILYKYNDMIFEIEYKRGRNYFEC
jgi:hypothetical protein